MLVALFAPSLAAADPAAPPAKVRRDPGVIVPDAAVRRGVLPNGMRYLVLQNPAPKGVVSIRLGIGAGSYEEGEDERGIAHFVEHMAFDGSRNFTAGVEDIFAARGVGFGRDQNAFTTLDSTSFHLDLPTAESAGLDLAFRWLRDVADGVTFAPAAVEHEKGVVLAEKEARSDANEVARQQVLRFQGPGLRSIMREPIGAPEVIRSMTADRLRTFYDRWYRPDNAVVVVVGDAPAEALEHWVKAAFANWTARGPAPARAATNPIDVRRGTDSLVVTDPHFPTELTVCRLRRPDPRQPDDVARLKRETIGAVWRAILDSRLSRARNAAQPPYLRAAIVHNDSVREAAVSCLVVEAIKDGWQTGLAAAQAEMRRFAAEGPTDAELESAVEGIRATYRGDAARTSTRQSGELATTLLTDALNGDVTAEPHEAFRAFDVAVEDLTPEEVKAGFAHDWSGAGPLVVLLSPDLQDKARLLATWKSGEGAEKLGKYVDAAAARWSYGPSSRPGRVVRREPVALGDFVRLTYRNGVVVNFKRVDSIKEAVEVRLRFGSGRREIPDAQYFNAMMATELFEAGGLKRHDYVDIDSFFRNGGWGAKLSMLDDAFVMHGSTTTGSVGHELEILAAYLTSPGFSTKLDAALPTAMDAVYRSYRTKPRTVVGLALTQAVDPQSPAAMPSREALARLRSADFEALLEPAVTTEPIEVTIVGDLDERTVTDLVAATLGALPARKAARPARTDVRFRRFSDRPLATIRTTHEGDPDKALVGVVWPLYVAAPERRREEVAIGLLSGVLSDRLLQRVRKELGKSYDPDARTSMPDNADQGYLMAMVEAYPADIEEVAAEIRKTAERLAKGDITAQELEAARKPILSGLAAKDTGAKWWASVLDGSARDPGRVKDALTTPDLFAAITLDEVRKAAADWLSRKPLVVIATPAAAKSGTAGQ